MKKKLNRHKVVAFGITFAAFAVGAIIGYMKGFKEGYFFGSEFAKSDETEL